MKIALVIEELDRSYMQAHALALIPAMDLKYFGHLYWGQVSIVLL